MSDIQHIKDLTPDPQNARRHNPRNIGMIERSLNEVGAGRSIVIDEDGVILAGNGLVEAAAQAGITKVQVVDVAGDTIIAVQRRGLTAEQKTKLALFDNRASDLSDWEPGILAEIADSGIDLSSLFTDVEWAEVSMPALPEPEKDAPVTIDEAEETRCQLGDVWRIGRHTVACMDSTDRANVERLIAGRKVGMVVADPPYGIDFDPTKDRGKLAPSISRPHVIGDETTETARNASLLCLSLLPDSAHVWWGANNYADSLPPSQCWIVWDKENGGNDFADVELAWTNQDTAARLFRHMWNGMLKDSERGERRVHATQKPVALFEWLYSRFVASLIFDPFLGSGPSLKAAEPLGRTVIGCELSPAYIDHILEWGEAHGLECTLLPYDDEATL